MAKWKNIPGTTFRYDEEAEEKRWKNYWNKMYEKYGMDHLLEQAEHDATDDYDYRDEDGNPYPYDDEY